jgi:hypothetical protein
MGKLSLELNCRFDWLGQLLSIHKSQGLTLDRIKLQSKAREGVFNGFDFCGPFTREDL